MYFLEKTDFPFQSLLGCWMFRLLTDLLIFVDPPDPTTMWTRLVSNNFFDWFPKSPRCLALNRKVSIFVHPCWPFEPNHSPLSNSLHIKSSPHRDARQVAISKKRGSVWNLGPSASTYECIHITMALQIHTQTHANMLAHTTTHTYKAHNNT